MLRRRLPLLMLCWALATCQACGDSPARVEQEMRETAESTLAEAPEEIQQRIRAACERWQDRVGQCDPDAVHADILACWTEKGLPNLEGAIKNGIRQRQRNRRVVLHHSLCMERRGWRMLPNSGGYF